MFDKGLVFKIVFFGDIRMYIKTGLGVIDINISGETEDRE